jgi:hypothetical protein
MIKPMRRNDFITFSVDKNRSISRRTEIKGNFHTKTLYCFGTKACFDRHKTIRINDFFKILSLFGSPLAKDYWHGYNSKWTENDFILFWNVTTELFIEMQKFLVSVTIVEGKLLHFPSL